MSTNLPAVGAVPIVELAKSLTEAMQSIQGAAASAHSLSCKEAQLLMDLVDEVRERLEELARIEDMTSDERRAVRAVQRSSPALAVWRKKLAAKKVDTLAAEEEERHLHTKVQEHLQIMQVDDSLMAAERAATVRQIAEDTEILAEIQREQALRIAADGAALDEAEAKVSACVEDTNQGVRELQGAVKHSYSSLGYTLGLTGAILVGGVAAVGGAAAAPALGAGIVGAAGFRYVGRKIAKQAVKNANKGIDEHLADTPM
ncbi:hypothetical protein DIPPA_55925 [Diplonema papillatum]|nr:hypothetical protein DIPPA_55925 [Diplonema papillatum]